MARGHTEVLLKLAIFRELTCANLYPEDRRRVNENVSKLSLMSLSLSISILHHPLCTDYVQVHVSAMLVEEL